MFSKHILTAHVLSFQSMEPLTSMLIDTLALRSTVDRYTVLPLSKHYRFYWGESRRSETIMRDRPSSEIETNITQITWRLSANFPIDLEFHPVRKKSF